MHFYKKTATSRWIADETAVQSNQSKVKQGRKKKVLLWHSNNKLLVSVTCVHLFGPCCTAGSAFLAAMFLQMEEIRRTTDPWGLVPSAKVSIGFPPPPSAHFPPLQRGPWVKYTSPSLHSRSSSCGYKLSLLTLRCSTDWMGIKIHSQPYLTHLYIQNMCSGSFPLHRHLFNSESAPATQKSRWKKNRSDHFRMFFSAD